MFRNLWYNRTAKNKTSSIIYDGLLSEEMVFQIRDMNKKYLYAVEVYCENFPWDDFHDFLPKHTYYQENDPGLEPHKRTGCLYGIVCKEDTHANRFFFFIDEKERQMFIDKFHSYIIDVNPFKTEIAA